MTFWQNLSMAFYHFAISHILYFVLFYDIVQVVQNPLWILVLDVII